MNKLASLVRIDEHGLMNEYKIRHRSNKSYASRSTAQTTTSYEEDVDLLLITIAQDPDYIAHKTDLLHKLYILATDIQ
jgi:hypothetical protein